MKKFEWHKSKTRRRLLQNVVMALSMLFFHVANAQNNAVLFDGSNDKITVPHNTAFNIGNTFTVEAWINATAWKSAVWAGTIVAKERPGPDSGFSLRSGDNGSLSFVLSVNQTWFDVSSSPMMPPQVWSHVAAVVNNGVVKLYINANEVASNTFTGNPTSNTNNLVIGESSGFPGRAFSGLIDEVRIWNIARTPEEITNNYTKELGGTENGLVAYYNLNEENGAIATNKISTPNTNGTLSGFDNVDDARKTGFQLPQNDLGIESILSPNALTAFERAEKVKIKIQNFGFNDVTNIPVGYKLDGQLQQEETVAVTLAPGESYIHTFSRPVSLTHLSNALITVFTAFDDDSNELNNELSAPYKKPIGTNKIVAINRLQHNFGAAGQTQFTSVVFPQDLSAFKQIFMNVKVECPTSGCDPWDQPAKISLIKNGRELEIGRFITPFGIGTCGPWKIDVTDFKDKLNGPATLKSFIQVFGSSGWLLTVDFEFVPEDNMPTFSKSTTLWTLDRLVYGDPNISHDLDAKSVMVDPNTTSAHIRTTVTGHGQGNTENAAEFSDKTHKLMVNNVLAASHRLFNTDCNVNACSPQNGTWTFSRAGWCPGQGVTPLTQDITSMIEAGQEVQVDYQLEDYVNLLNTGYDGAGHTEPNYRIWGYLVEESATRFNDYTNLTVTALTLDADTSGVPAKFGPLSISLKNTGTVDIVNPEVTYFNNGVLASTETVNQTILPGEEISYNFQTLAAFETNTFYEIVAAANVAGDENSDDDAWTLEIGTRPEPEPDPVTNLDGAKLNQLKIYPNPPVNGEIHIEGLNKNSLYVLKIYNASGKLIGKRKLDGKESFDLKVSQNRYLILTIEGSRGDVFSYKILEN